MTLTELMQGHSPDPDYEGWVTSDDLVLAVDVGATPAADFTNTGAFAVAEMGVTGLDAQLGPITQEKTYIRAGRSTVKTGTQRGFKITADRYVGDEFQDFCLSHAVKYGTGSAVVRKYVCFDLLTGRGECGEVSIIVEADGSGEAGECAKVEIELKKCGALPAEYTYGAQ